jgi:hypothetical protein
MEQQKKNQNQTPSLSANKAGSTVSEKKSVLELLEEDDEFEVISPTVFFPSVLFCCFTAGFNLCDLLCCDSLFLFLLFFLFLVL